MNGPEHYREAEWLLRKYDQITDAGGDPGDMLAGAQVHATLALAAATAMPNKRMLPLKEYREWHATLYGTPEGDE